MPRSRRRDNTTHGASPLPSLNSTSHIASKRTLRHTRHITPCPGYILEVAVEKMVSHAIFQYNIFAIDDTYNTWTNIIVKMTIRRLLGSSDDKDKICVVRPEGPPLRWSKGQELKRLWRNPSRKDQDEDNLLSPVKPMMSKLHSSVQWTQKLRARVWHRINRRWVFYTHRCNGLGGRRSSRSFTGTG